jgi:Ni,Fe-hydrogenase I cytochrome b subunit
MNFNITLFVFAIFCAILLCKEWIDYYQVTDVKKYQNEIRYLNIASEYLIISTMILITVGFALYFKQQHTDHFKNFSFITFILGTANNPVKC